MIKIENLTKSFNNSQILKGVSLNIDDGEIFGIIGQSGAGKSTLLRCINSLETFDSGVIEADGVKIDSKNKNLLRNVRMKMAMIFQSFNLLERLNVYENIALPMKFHGIKTHSESSRKKIESLVHLVGLDEKINCYPRELSGGQKQRVAIARALSLEPKILLCDEATSALDPEITKGILALLDEINKKLGITILMVTHQMEVVKQVCTRVAFLNKGVVLATGRPEELFIQPKFDEIRQFLTDKSNNLPKEGVNIQLFFFAEGAREPIVTRMARALDMDFSIHWAKIEDFRDKAYGSLVLNVKDENVKRVCSFLTENNVSYEVLKR